MTVIEVMKYVVDGGYDGVGFSAPADPTLMCLTMVKALKDAGFEIVEMPTQQPTEKATCDNCEKTGCDQHIAGCAWCSEWSEKETEPLVSDDY